MKKMFLTATLAGMAFAGCSSNEDPVVQEQQAIDFAPVNYLSQTRAGSEFTAADFGVSAWSGTDQDQSINTNSFMNQVQITKDNRGVWKPASSYFWPDKLIDNAHIDFFGYAPHANAPVVNVGTATSQNTVKYDVDFTIPYKTDILYSDKAIDQTSVTGANGVNLFFHHALSYISFMAKTVDTSSMAQGGTIKVTLNSIEVTNIKNKGSYTLTLNTDKKTWQSPDVWTGDASGQKTNWLASDINFQLKSTPKKITIPGDYMESYVMPQSLGDDAMIKIGYNIYFSIPSVGPATTKTYTAEVQLNKIVNPENQQPITAWNRNQSITYVLTVDPSNALKPISFKPQVVEMESYQQNGETNVTPAL